MSSYRPSNGKAPVDEVETVDLTFSSPEPEPQPKQPHQQRQYDRYLTKQRVSGYLKKELGRTPIRANGASSSSSRHHTAAANISDPLPSVSAEHLRQIINTSSPQKVAELLLDLCKSSPALSGAVARGLAPHSTWAQNTIKDYQRRTGVAQVKSEVGKPSSSSGAIPGRTSENRSYESPRTPYSKAPVRSEVGKFKADSDDSLSDLEMILAQPSRSSRGKAVAGPTSSIHRAAPDETPPSSMHLSQPPLPVRVKPEPQITALLCMQCDKMIQPGTNCLYHLGRPKMSTQGSQKIQLWTCCNKPLDAAGCCNGDHIPLRESTYDPVPTLTGPKKPRLV
ncbi:uncharacterized protein CC84DRAFT_185638 [Paraphaeosphaeria sporulosa]|uniref:Uncharacterized protein n=1 Tax=Paraphaeosphaeria sporulosa TaxID=1460663 RepID=A0A177C2A5_9PLEO|nr:uncharacterized protein CC84DRAFT_185638 [Paraphaeosphaeria sporulosa]OAG01291.1 hypothetical protein CC84DRAFT_185638 [Paraphaeosphaeria sporulosa]